MNFVLFRIGSEEFLYYVCICLLTSCVIVGLFARFVDVSIGSLCVKGFSF